MVACHKADLHRAVEAGSYAQAATLQQHASASRPPSKAKVRIEDGPPLPQQRTRTSGNTFMLFNGSTKLGLTAATLAMSCATSAIAAEYNLRGAHIFPENYIQSGKNLDAWADSVSEATDGKVAFNIVHGGALLSQADHLDGIANGLVDVTSFYPIYFPGEFKVEGALTNIIDIWSEDVPDLEGVATIHAQLHSEFPQFAEEYERRNMQMLLPLPADPYLIVCTEEVTQKSDLEGGKMRTFGRYFPILQEGLGVEPVTVPGPEAYQALATGLIDCVYSTPDWVYSNSLHEVAPHIFVPAPEQARPQLFSTAVIAMNSNSFDNLPEDVQEKIMEVSENMTSYIGSSMEGVYQTALDNLTAAEGATINFMTEEELAEWAESTPNQLDQAAADLEEEGLPGEKIIARYRELASDYVASAE